MAVRVLPLGSSSSGNALLVEFGRRRLLVDAGLSSRELARRLDAVGCPPASLGCILLTHEHHDHSRGAERFSVKHRVPVACVPETLEAMNLSRSRLAAFIPLEPGRALELDGVRVLPFPVPHDAVCPLGFALEGDGVRVGVALDLGHATALVAERLRGSHVLVVESNHDGRMLQEGPYPWHLKQRIASRLGHLSNDEAAVLLGRASSSDLRAIVLAHLSEKNNTQELARAAAVRALAQVGARRFEMRVAERRRPTVPVIL
jgi:phosphoribosyl 1,2-cyclic phosphodiesterase